MALPYDTFTGAFLAKVTSYDLANMEEDMATDIIDGYMKAAIAAFKQLLRDHRDFFRLEHRNAHIHPNPAYFSILNCQI